MLLEDYLQIHQISMKEFAESIHYTEDHIRNAIRGFYPASTKLAYMIEVATKGAVSGVEFRERCCAVFDAREQEKKVGICPRCHGTGQATEKAKRKRKKSEKD